MATKRRTAILRQQLVQLIEQSGLSVYEIGKRSGIDKAQLSRFMNSKGGMTLDTLEKLALVLGIELAKKEAGHAR